MFCFMKELGCTSVWVPADGQNLLTSGLKKVCGAEILLILDEMTATNRKRHKCEKQACELPSPKKTVTVNTSTGNGKLKLTHRP